MSLARKINRQLKRKMARPGIEDAVNKANRIRAINDVRIREQEEEHTMYSFSCILAICCRVLVKDFGWGKLPPGYANERYKLARFAIAVQREINELNSTRNLDIKKYCDMVYEEIGVKFEYK